MNPALYGSVYSLCVPITAVSSHHMRLYKYYGYEAGLAALRSQRLGFRRPNDFNDPLELSFPIDDSSPSGMQLARALNVLREWVVILSLTETPTDALMWTHYGDEHRGFVVGYDMSDPFLSSPEYNLITVDNGAVTYSAPSSAEIAAVYDDSTVQYLLHFGLGAPLSERQLDDVRSLANKAFLTKHPRWHTEKEVRVVKLLNSAFEEVSAYQSDPLRTVVPYHRDVAPGYACELVRGLHLYKHQVKIEEVYLGAHNPMAKQNRDRYAQSDRSLAERAETLGWVVRGISTSPSSWDLGTVDLDSDALVIEQRKIGLTYISTFDAGAARALTKLADHEIDDKDRFELTTWNGVSYLRKNGEFI